jgi:uncharacterized protein YutE (UPF0331/DUF86 family)
MQELDIQKIKFRISEIQESLLEIRKYIAMPEKDFWQDHRNILAIEQLLLRAIEASGSICLHFAVKKLKKGVDSFSQCFELMLENGLVDKNLSENLIRMSRFRNLLVHKYWNIDEKRVYEYAKNNLADFEKFISSIKQQINGFLRSPRVRNN